MIEVKKRISISTNDYTVGLVFIAVPFNQYDSMTKEVTRLQSLDQGKSGAESFNFIKDTLSSRFVEGTFKQDGEETALTKDNIFELPGDVLIDAFQQLLGQTSPNS